MSTQKAPVDPAVLASIRWFANFLEMMAMERYMGDRKNAAHIKALFTKTAKELKKMNFNGECPDGWERCGDNKCEPTCLDQL